MANQFLATFQGAFTSTTAATWIEKGSDGIKSVRTTGINFLNKGVTLYTSTCIDEEKQGKIVAGAATIGLATLTWFGGWFVWKIAMTLDLVTCGFDIYLVGSAYYKKDEANLSKAKETLKKDLYTLGQDAIRNRTLPIVALAISLLSISYFKETKASLATTDLHQQLFIGFNPMALAVHSKSAESKEATKPQHDTSSTH